MKIKPASLKVIKNVLVWLISLNLSWVFVEYGLPKFDPEGFWTGAFTKWGYGQRFMYFIGVLEIAGAIAILIPAIASFGGFTLALVMAGALITRLIHGVSMVDAISIIGFMVTSLFVAFYWLKHFPYIHISED